MIKNRGPHTEVGCERGPPNGQNKEFILEAQRGPNGIPLKNGIITCLLGLRVGCLSVFLRKKVFLGESFSSFSLL